MALEFNGFKIDSLLILRLCDTIADKQWHKIKKSGSVKAFNAFLIQNYLANNLMKEQAVYLRDELDYNEIILKNRSDSTLEFIQSHPQSFFYAEAVILRQRQIYAENTKNGTAPEFINFISKNKENIMLYTAYENLYKLYKLHSDINGLKTFVHSYPDSPQLNEAWKLLFSLSVKSFSNEELEKFLTDHPSFPFKKSIKKDLELNKIELWPYEKDELFGFIDSTANIKIAPQYDSVSDFSEGLSVVNKNDTVFYINKENINPFNHYYSEAYPFKNGIAVVKQENKWDFINRQGQIISGNYEEVNELSNMVYVIKINGKYGAINNLGQTIIEPRFQKLGDFKNEYAYYIEEGKYGFVSKSGYVHKAEFDWISNFNEKNIAVIKQNSLFGLINSDGRIILEPLMDAVVKSSKNVFIVVRNAQYGFFNGGGCFLSTMTYDYLKEKPAEFYTNGILLKFLKNNEQSIADFNGKQLIEFGAYDEIHFAGNGLSRVKRKNKYGFIDKKFQVVIPFKYQMAKDFVDSVAVVESHGKNALINLQGKEIYSSTEPIEKLSRHYYSVGEDKMEIINSKGEKILNGAINIQMGRKGLLIIILSNNEIKLLKD
ncbi:MAG: hypothetical protein JWO32_753 [Bacteroidetes bacterium]|nr:hypothetical protein [Bacteroidota bacterium]